MKPKSRRVGLLVACCAALLTACGAAENGAEPRVVADRGNLDDAEYLTQLGLIRGHLAVGLALYRRDETALAKTHMKHPGDELYAALEPEFARRGGSGFGAELQRLATTVETDAPREEAESAYAVLLDRIDAAERLTVARDAEQRQALETAVLRGLLSHAQEEYQIGVRGGHIVDLHEYQDAWGFTRVALRRAEVARNGSGDPDNWAAVVVEIESLGRLWPDILPGGDIPGDAQPFGPVLASLGNATPAARGD